MLITLYKINLTFILNCTKLNLKNSSMEVIQTRFRYTKSITMPIPFSFLHNRWFIFAVERLFRSSTSFDAINPVSFHGAARLDSQSSRFLWESDNRFWPSAPEATSNCEGEGDKKKKEKMKKKKEKKERKKVFKQLLNPKAYATAIYALTWKTRIQRERRILWLACMYTSWETKFPSSHPFVEGEKQAPEMRRVIVNLCYHRFHIARETFEHAVRRLSLLEIVISLLRRVIFTSD